MYVWLMTALDVVNTPLRTMLFNTFSIPLIHIGGSIEAKSGSTAMIAVYVLVPLAAIIIVIIIIIICKNSSTFYVLQALETIQLINRCQNVYKK